MPKRSRMTQSVADARKDARNWIDLEDFVHFLRSDTSGQVSARKGLALFSSQDWINYANRVKPESRETLLRGFERWKRGWARPNDVLITIEELEATNPELADWADSTAFRLFGPSYKQNTYYLPLTRLRERVDQAILRRDTLVQAMETATGKTSKTAPPKRKARKVARTATIKEVMAHFNVPYNTVITWAVVQGAPHDHLARRKARGGMTKRKYFFFNIEELENWRRSRRATGMKAARERERVPIEEATKTLNEVRGSLNLTLEKFASLLDVNKHTLRGWLEPRGTSTGRRASQTVPKSVVTNAELLLEIEERRPTRHEGALAATPEKVREALREAGGVRERASKTLGISRGAVKKIADLYQIPYRQVADPLLLQFSSQDVREAMDKAECSVKGAARLLGVSPPSMARLISSKYGYGLEEEFEENRIRKGVAPKRKKAMERAIKKAKGDRRETARILGINADLTSRLAREWKLDHLFRRAGRLEHTKAQVEAALEEAKKQGIAKTRVGPDILGVSSTGLRRLIRDYELGEQYEALKKRPAVRKGTMKPSYPKSQVEEWLSHAEREGLSASEAAAAAGVHYNTLVRYVKLHGLHERMKKIRKSRRFLGESNPPVSPGDVLEIVSGSQKGATGLVIDVTPTGWLAVEWDNGQVTDLHTDALAYGKIRVLPRFRGNPDRETRELERRASMGDLEAQTKLDLQRLRFDGKVVLSEETNPETGAITWWSIYAGNPNHPLEWWRKPYLVRNVRNLPNRRRGQSDHAQIIHEHVSVPYLESIRIRDFPKERAIRIARALESPTRPNPCPCIGAAAIGALAAWNSHDS